MSFSMKIRRWRVRQRRSVVRALWMHGPFTAPEARVMARKINYSPVAAGKLIRAHEQDLRERERDLAVEQFEDFHADEEDTTTFRQAMGVRKPDQLLKLPAVEIRRRRARHMDAMRERAEAAA